jgi:hypothetical protein
MADCAKCGQPIKDGASFCAQCGATVKHCPQCGQLLIDGARFCGACGAVVSEPSPDPQAPAYPPAPPVAANPVQAAGPPSWVNFTVVDYSGFFGQVTNTIVVDGNDVRTVQIGETVVFQVPPGSHAIQLVQVFRSVATLKMGITRKSNLLEFTVAPGTQAVVAAEYGFILGKFSLSLR